MGYMTNKIPSATSLPKSRMSSSRSHHEMSEMRKRYFETPTFTGGKEKLKISEDADVRINMPMYFMLIMLMFAAILIPLLFGDHRGP